MTPDELRQLLRQPEGEQLEFKRRLPAPHFFASLVGAFANTRGGILIVGADEREPERGGLAHPHVAADHAREWIERLVTPVPAFSTEVVSLGAGRDYLVVRVEPGPSPPYMADGRVLERRGVGLVPITAERINQAVARSEAETPATDHLADSIASMAAVIERLEGQLHWKRQLPLQAALLVAGAIVGYLLGVWNPLA